MNGIITEDVEIVLDDERYVLEKGDRIVFEKWEGDVEIKQTGEHANKTVDEIKKQIANLKKRQEGKDKADPKITKTLRELNFALRAKTGWKKGTAKR
jgi:hypothetical protein